jgi:hypothetical protein
MRFKGLSNPSWPGFSPETPALAPDWPAIFVITNRMERGGQKIMGVVSAGDPASPFVDLIRNRPVRAALS